MFCKVFYPIKVNKLFSLKIHRQSNDYTNRLLYCRRAAHRDIWKIKKSGFGHFNMDTDSSLPTPFHRGHILVLRYGTFLFFNGHCEKICSGGLSSLSVVGRSVSVVFEIQHDDILTEIDVIEICECLERADDICLRKFFVRSI